MKPCPFCGAVGDRLMELWDLFDAGHVAHIHCIKCGSSGPSIYSETSAQDAINKARAQWNERKVNK